jgi:acetyltransferase-like isoleucine patch superfamily enzyme
MLAPSFAAIGRGTLIYPGEIGGTPNISLGANVTIGPACKLAAYPGSTIAIGDRTTLLGFTEIGAKGRVAIGCHVMIARSVFIADHSHGRDDPTTPIMDQPDHEIRPVVVGDGAWLGHGVVILPGVTIGAGAIVGANSVVRSDVPDHHVAAGAPARVIRSLL